jgi:hypothetical protein
MVRRIMAGPLPSVAVKGSRKPPRLLCGCHRASNLSNIWETPCLQKVNLRIDSLCGGSPPPNDVSLPLFRSYLEALNSFEEAHLFLLKDREWAEHAARYVLLRLDSFYVQVALEFQQLFAGREDTCGYNKNYETLPKWLAIALRTWTCVELPGGRRGEHYGTSFGAHNPTTQAQLSAVASALPLAHEQATLDHLPERVVRWLLYSSVQATSCEDVRSSAPAKAREAWDLLAEDERKFAVHQHQRQHKDLSREWARYRDVNTWILWVGRAEQRLKNAGITLPPNWFTKSLPAGFLETGAIMPDMELVWATLARNKGRRGYV